MSGMEDQGRREVSWWVVLCLTVALGVMFERSDGGSQCSTTRVQFVRLREEADKGGRGWEGSLTGLAGVQSRAARLDGLLVQEMVELASTKATIMDWFPAS